MAPRGITMRIISVLCLLLCSSIACSSSSFSTPLIHPSPDLFSLLSSSPFAPPHHQGGHTFKQALAVLRDEIIQWASEFIGPERTHELISSSPSSSSSSSFPYFRFLPFYRASALPGGVPSSSWNNTCFSQNTLSMTNSTGPSNSYTITLTPSAPASPSCSDFYLLSSTEGLKFHTVAAAQSGPVNIEWTPADDATPDELWDLEHNGVRLYSFAGSPVDCVEWLLETLLLFSPEMSKGVPTGAAKRNVDFVEKYSGFKMTPRPAGHQQISLNASLIHSGDLFGIIRLDGLDPMIGWASGAATGHTTTALWVNGELFVCESTTTDSYWPTNGVQITPYAQWLKQAHDAGYNVVHAPLSEEARAAYNATRAYEYFLSVQGYDYGYHTMLWAWIDTLTDNYPCLPPAFNDPQCFSWEDVTFLFGLLDRVWPYASHLLYREAWNKRLNTGSDLPLAGLLREAHRLGVEAAAIPAMVEQDGWTYNTTRYGKPAVGPSLVCSVFVCHMWKAGGLFQAIDNNIQCGEQTTFDVAAMAFLAAPARPQECVDEDPDNALCQLDGAYSLYLNGYASRKPYPNMNEKCASLPLEYKREDGC